jgi:hypothetical protein
VAILAYNVLALITRAITVQHRLDTNQFEVSPYYLANEIQGGYRGMTLVVAESTWNTYEQLSARELAQTLLRIAAHAEPHRLRKHTRGPKARAKKGFVSRNAAQRHVATARVLRDGKIK